MFTVEQYAKGHKLTAEALANAQRTVAFANDVMNALPGRLRVTSTVRTPAHNKSVGGVPNSKHLTTRALAIDFVPVDGKYSQDLLTKYKAVADRHSYSMLIHNVTTGKHIHSEYKPGKSPAQTKPTTKAVNPPTHQPTL